MGDSPYSEIRDAASSVIYSRAGVFAVKLVQLCAKGAKESEFDKYYALLTHCRNKLDEVYTSEVTTMLGGLPNANHGCGGMVAANQLELDCRIISRAIRLIERHGSARQWENLASELSDLVGDTPDTGKLSPQFALEDYADIEFDNGTDSALREVLGAIKDGSVAYPSSPKAPAFPMLAKKLYRRLNMSEDTLGRIVIAAGVKHESRKPYDALQVAAVCEFIISNPTHQKFVEAAEGLLKEARNDTASIPH